MTVISERAIVCVVKVEAPSQQAADEAFDDLLTRVSFTLPKLRFGPVRILARNVTVRRVSIRGTISKAPDAKA